VKRWRSTDAFVHRFATDRFIDVFGRAADVDVALIGADEVAAMARGFAAARAGLDAAEARWLGELETRGVCDRFGSKTASWVAHETRADQRSVKTRVQVGVEVGHRFALAGGALAAGAITFDHARAFVEVTNPRVIDRIADMQELLIAHAQDRPFPVWRSELQALVALLDQDGAKATGAPPDARRPRRTSRPGHADPGDDHRDRVVQPDPTRPRPPRHPRPTTNPRRALWRALVTNPRRWVRSQNLAMVASGVGRGENDRRLQQCRHDHRLQLPARARGTAAQGP
jgi:hypothetical protein